MSKLTLDEAIKHCLEVAEKNDSEAEVYDLLAKNHNSTYEKLTALRFCTDCVECAADYRQLAEWLTELKDLREENKVLMQECDRLIKEKGELLSKVSGGDVLRIYQLEEQFEKAKRLLKAAIEDINAAGACETCEYYPVINSDMCQKDDCYKWCYANEALKLLNDEK